MLNAGTVQSFATLNTQGFKSGIRNLKKQGERFSKDMQKSFDKIGRGLTSVGRKMSMSISAPLLGAGALAVKTAADYERLQIQINTLAGSAEKGAKIFKDLQEFSAGTPFQLGDLAKANNILVGMGQTSENAFSNLKMLGDVASATGANINELAVTFGQASAEGKLMSRDIREFINRGVPLTKLLADSMGVAKNEIFDLASQGKISFEVLQKALTDATTGTGIYAGATEKAADSIWGVWSTLKDNSIRAFAEIGDTLVKELDMKELMKSLTKSIQSGIKWFGELSESTKKYGVIIAGLATALGPTIFAFGALARSMSGILLILPKLIAGVKALTAAMIANPYLAVGAAVLALGIAFYKATDRAKGLRQEIEKIDDIAPEMKEDALTQSIARVANRIQELKDEFGDVPLGEVNLLQEELDKLITKRDNLAKKELDRIISSRAVKEEVQALTDWNARARETVDRVRDLKSAAQQPVDRIFDPSIVKEEFQSINDIVAQMETRTGDFSHRLTEDAKKGGEAIMGLTQTIGTMFERAVLHGQNLQGVVGGILKQLASRAFITGIGALLTGGASLGGGSFLSAMFGGLFHSGGVVGGSGDKMIRAKGGEMVLTKSQQKALSMGGGGQSVSINPNAIGQAVARELDKRIKPVSGSRIFELSQQGRANY